LSPIFEYDVELNAYFTKELAATAPSQIDLLIAIDGSFTD
jgi:hypothetical protein